MPSRIRIILLDFTRNGTRVTDRNREVETKKEINGERETHGETERTKDVETHTEKEMKGVVATVTFLLLGGFFLLILIEVLFSDLIGLSKICTVR